MKKGISVSIWIWIIGGLIAAMLTVTAAYFNLAQVGSQVSRQNVVDDFNTLNKDIGFICQQAAGSRTSKTLALKGVRAIYAADNRGKPPDDVPQLISNSRTEKGDYLCLTFTNSHYGCTEHQCPVNMTYIGRPLPGTDMYALGSGDGRFEFKLTIRKNASGSVVVTAAHRP
ncbi:MAG: hypothetical protein SVU32_05380 [Candidatus Nanohaloarchaea archaeon]|nr:hypothetical protein [Candidatus Nanohaloarchaea archaeon]